MMIDKIVELENGKKYVMLDCKRINNITYYFGLRLDNNNEPTNNYLFFEEAKYGEDTYLSIVEDEKMKGLLLTTFTVNYLDKVYEEV